jgi:type II secretory pathway pseudopilin PulG
MKSFRSQAGFTVLEMLIACLLLSILSIMLFQALDNVTRITSRFQGKGAIYQDTRVVLDQLTRDLQQAMPYTTSIPGLEAFRAKHGGPRVASELHFVASIDNPKGSEETEVHYYYDGVNTIWKTTVLFAPPTYWDIDVNLGWYGTPSLPMGGAPSGGQQYDYYPILEGVDSFTFKYWTNNIPMKIPALVADNEWKNMGDHIPAYFEAKIAMFDRYQLRRWGTAENIRTAASIQTNLMENFTIKVQLPMSKD